MNLQAPAETNGVLIVVSQRLQALDIDFVTGFNYVMAVKEVLGAMCQKPVESFASVFQAAEKLATDMHLTIAKPRIPKRSVYRSAAGDSDDSVADYYHIKMFIPLLDKL